MLASMTSRLYIGGSNGCFRDVKKEQMDDCLYDLFFFFYNIFYKNINQKLIDQGLVLFNLIII